MLRSYMFGSQNDNAPFKDFNVLNRIKDTPLDTNYLWKSREDVFPIKRYLHDKNNLFYLVLDVYKDKIKLYNPFSNEFIYYYYDFDKKICKGNIIELIEKPIFYKKLNIKDVFYNKDYVKFINNYSLYPKFMWNLENIRDELVYYLIKMDNKELYNMIVEIFKKYWHNIVVYPASLGHHNYLGGLLVHIVENIRIATTILKNDSYENEELFENVYKISRNLEWLNLKNIRLKNKFNTMDKIEMGMFLDDFCNLSHNILSEEITIGFDEIVAVYCLHDLGKIYDSNLLYTDYTKWDILDFKYSKNDIIIDTLVSDDIIGNKYGHLFLSSLIFERLSLGFNVNKHEILRYIITHHSKIKYGSIQESNNVNEFLIHYADKISAFYNLNNDFSK